MYFKRWLISHDKIHLPFVSSPKFINTGVYKYKHTQVRYI